MKKYLEYKDGKSSKFWQVEVNGSSYTVIFGKIGTAGQTQNKSFASMSEAKAEATKQMQSKLKKGYVEVEQGETTEDTTNNNKVWLEEDFWYCSSFYPDAFDDIEKDDEVLENTKETPAHNETEIPKVEESDDDDDDWDDDDDEEEDGKSNVDKQLLTACRRGNLEQIKKLVENEGANIRAKAYFGENVIAEAFNSWNGDDVTEIVKYLIRKGASYKDTSIDGEKDENPALFKCIEAFRKNPEIDKIDEIFEEVLNPEWDQTIEPLLKGIRETIEEQKQAGKRYWGWILQLSTSSGRFEIYAFNRGRVELKEIKTNKDLDGFNYVAAFNRIPQRIDKEVKKMAEEGLFDPIAKSNFTFRLGHREYENEASHIFFTLDNEVKRKEEQAAYKKMLDEFKTEENWKNLDEITDIMYFGRGLIESNPVKAVEMAGVSIFSIDEEESDLAADILDDYRRLDEADTEAYYYLGMFEKANLDFKEAEEKLEWSANAGYEPAKKELELLKKGGGSPKKEGSGDKKKKPFDEVFSTAEIFTKNEYFTAKASKKKGFVQIAFNNETEEAYNQALDFINNLMKKGYSSRFDGYQLMVKFAERPIFVDVKGFPDVPVNAFFAKAATFPALHGKIREYTEHTLVEYDGYVDLDWAEDCTPVGAFAASALVMNNIKNIDLASRYAEAIDGEHEQVQLCLLDAILDKYGVIPETIPAIFDLFVSYEQDYGMKLPKEMHTNPQYLKLVMEHGLGRPHRATFRDSTFVNFVERALMQDNTKKNLKTVKALAEATSGEDANIFYDFYNTYKNLAAEYHEEDFGDDILPETSEKSFQLLKETIPVVITKEEAEKRGIDLTSISGKETTREFFSVFHPFNIIDPEVKKHFQIQWKKLCEIRGLAGQVSYGTRVAKFNEWYIDYAAMPSTYGVVLLDGKNKPEVLYGVLNYAKAVKNCSKLFKTEKAKEKAQLSNTVMDAPAGIVPAQPPTQTEKYMDWLFSALYTNKYYRAEKIIERLKPEDGEYYLTGLMYLVDIARKKKDYKQAFEASTLLAELSPGFSEYWKKEADGYKAMI